MNKRNFDSLGGTRAVNELRKCAKDIDSNATVGAAQSINVVGYAGFSSLHYTFVESAGRLIADATPAPLQKLPSSSIPETSFSNASSAKKAEPAQDKKSSAQIESLRFNINDFQTTIKEMQKQTTVLRQDRDLLQWRFEDLERDVEEQIQSKADHDEFDGVREDVSDLLEWQGNEMMTRKCGSVGGC
jgi:TolA-binding protein